MAKGYSFVTEDIPNSIGRMQSAVVSYGADKALSLAPNRIEAPIRRGISVVQNDYATLKHWYVDNSAIPSAVDALGLGDFKIARTHYGDMIWQHAMTTGSGLEAQGELSAGVWRGLNNFRNLIKKDDYLNAGYQLGKVLHYIQDSWTPSHAARDDSGNVLRFYNYLEQSGPLHGVADSPDSGSAVFANAVNASVEVIGMTGFVELPTRHEIAFNLFNIVGYDSHYPDPYRKRATWNDVESIGYRYGVPVDGLKTQANKMNGYIGPYIIRTKAIALGGIGFVKWSANRLRREAMELRRWMIGE